MSDDSTTKVMKTKRTGSRGDKTNTTTFTAPPAVVRFTDEMLVKRVHALGKYKCKRSRVLVALLYILNDAVELIDLSAISDMDSLRREVSRGIVKKGAVARSTYRKVNFSDTTL